ncbi:radical SAM protein [Streptosporangium carneum]|uniref:Radical SAM core domain-containing protein n=1 Tax=Streptosporangium carneum TaxID=47481 RepID=A0A9W6I3R7_9ACTN|nr:radical SAM protein [Streptosporangium carneum]GLK11133.1 hypothetical protein GCM10017600_45390 [Streptosporangium carneum]
MERQLEFDRWFGHAKTLVLQPTTLCNLDCVYCYLPFRRLSNEMSPEVAQAVADSAAELTDPSGPLDIVWHGGEPLALGLRKFGALLAPFEDLRQAGRIQHSVQTNATLIDDEWCDLAAQNEDNVSAPAVAKAIGKMNNPSLTGALAKLCPSVAQAQEDEEERMRAENDAYIAAAKKRCSSHPRHQPKIRPVRQARATMWTEFWYINAWDEGNEGGSTGDMVADLVGSAPGALDIWAADEIGHACVTGEAYRRRPPVETRGWEQVVEVGYTTAKGTLSIVGDNGEELPDLAVNGPGDYRVRVHVRGRKAVRENIDTPDATVQLLIMVFPGKEKKPTIYRDYPQKTRK